MKIHRAPRGTKILVLLFVLSLTGPVRAQLGNEGSIEGVVTDPSGAVIPGVALRVTNLGTSAAFSTTTNELGLFRFPVLSVGSYELVAKHPGFASLIQKNVVVNVGAEINLTLSLTLATGTETLLVSGETPLLESTRSQVSTTVDARSVANLPLNGRNFLGFVFLAPGVTPGVTPAASGVSVTFGGQRGMNSFLLDGADDSNTFQTGPLGGLAGSDRYQLSQEAVQELQVNTNSYSAELGRAGAGVVSVITKSGTNEIHGSLFWYFRDRALNATGLISKNLGEPKEPLHVHQFGGAVGGPIRKNKLFFFANYDGQRRTEFNVTFLNLPFGFTTSSDPIIAGFQQRALDYLTPRAISWIRGFDQDVYLAKMDWHITPTHRLSGRWNRQRFSGANLEQAGSQVSFERTGASEENSDTLAVSLTSTISSLPVNVARFSYVSSNQPGRPNGINPAADIFEGGQPVLTVGRASLSPREIAIRRGEWSDTLSLGRGRHAFKVGTNVLLDRIMFFTAINFSGSYRFNSLESFGRSLAGTPVPVAGERYVQAFPREGTPGVSVHPNVAEFAGFFQDEWRARPGLTFNLGLRYDVQEMARPRVKNPAPALTAAGLDTSFVPQDNNNFAPRIGFAWTPLRSKTFVVRGGYGFFYARTAAGLAARAHFLNGLTVQTRSFVAGTSSAALIPAYPNTLCGPPDTTSGAPPTCPAPTTGADIIMPFDPDYIQPLVQQGSFGVEYQFQRDASLSVSYLADRGTHLQRYRDVNLGTPSTPTTIGIAATSTILTFPRFTLPQPIAGFDRVLLFESSANSIYHGLAVQLKKRFSQEFQFLASYTFSKVIDDLPDSIPLSVPLGDSRLLSDGSNPRVDRAPSVSDQRHRFVLSGVWQLNYAKALPAAAKAILGGWELSGILTAQSGLPYSGLVNFDLNNDGNSATDRSPGLGRNTFSLPTTVSLDPRVTRNVQFTERVRLQFIWEAFNVFNRANISGVRTTQFSRSTSTTVCGIAGTPCLVPQNVGATAFGTPTATSGPRIMQLALKLLF